MNIERTTLKETETYPESVEEELMSLDESSVEEDSSENKAEIASSIIVDVKGAVSSPGIYEMEEDDRIHDLINQAGGFTKQANEAEINLAQKLQDEMVITVPKKGEIVEDIPAITSGSTGEDVGEKVKINDATQAELETLNGIGPSKAQAIIEYREEHGAFQTIEDVLEVSGIGEKTLESFKEGIIVP